jgi:hypothetical protein
MRATRMWSSLLTAIAALAVGCGSTGGGASGPSDQDFINALHLESVGGEYAVKGTLCGVARFLHDSDEVASANTAQKGSVLASRDRTIGIVIVPPFANTCANDAQRELNKLSRSQ